jgi:hypothetical protein
MNRIWPTPQKKHALLGGLIGMNAHGEIPIRIVSSLVRISGQILLILIPPGASRLEYTQIFSDFLPKMIMTGKDRASQLSLTSRFSPRAES